MCLEEALSTSIFLSLRILIASFMASSVRIAPPSAYWYIEALDSSVPLSSRKARSMSSS